MEGKKCSFDEHKEINSIKYCPECRIYMCNKCEINHSSLFKNHHQYNINKEEDIFTGFCKEKNHHNKLKYYCKNHNQLCCVECIAKLNKEGEGQHKDCEVFYLENIKEEKKNKLKENIRCLEDLQNKFNELMKSLNIIFEEIEKNKENLKLEIQNVFTKIRNAINDREEQLLLDVDKLYDDKYFNEDIIKKSGKLPKQIELSLEKGKLLDKEWDNNNLNSYINDSINIENSIKNINIINQKINKGNLNNKMKLKFIQKDNPLDKFMETIKSFGQIDYLFGYSLRECPKNIKDGNKYIVTGDNKNILTKLNSNNWVGTICQIELDKSIEEHKWKIKFLKTYNKAIMVGVAPIDFDINSTCQFNSCGWFLNCYNSALNSGPPFNYRNFKTNLSKVNDEIIVVMNMKKRTIKFIINNEDKGDSYNNIPVDKPLFPAICLHYKDDSVEINEI